MFISKGDQVDIRTFIEKKDKPYLLPNPSNPQIDAFRYFHNEMTGHVLDFIYQVLKTAQKTTRTGQGRRRFTKALSSMSCDPEYIETLLKASTGQKKKIMSSELPPVNEKEEEKQDSDWEVSSSSDGGQGSPSKPAE